jgi:hypothetical protein
MPQASACCWDRMCIGAHVAACRRMLMCACTCVCRAHVHVTRTRMSCVCIKPSPGAVLARSFVRGRQEDAHEYLRCLVDALERDLLRGERRWAPGARRLQVHGAPRVAGASPRTGARGGECGCDRAAQQRGATPVSRPGRLAPRTARRRPRARLPFAPRPQCPGTLVNVLFQGAVLNTVECLACGHASNTWDPIQVGPRGRPRTCEGAIRACLPACRRPRAEPRTEPSAQAFTKPLAPRPARLPAVCRTSRWRSPAAATSSTRCGASQRRSGWTATTPTSARPAGGSCLRASR